MTAMNAPVKVEKFALHSSDGKAWTCNGSASDGAESFAALLKKFSGDTRVTKVVLGELGEDKAIAIELPAAFTEQLASTFPALTHLHLWGLSELAGLASLPPGLQELDVRNCVGFASLPELPGALVVLGLEALPALTKLKLPTGNFTQLLDLNLRGCKALPESVIGQLLQKVPALELLDLSECVLLTKLEELPATVCDVRLNDCPHLFQLPPSWPRVLRRLELRNAVNVTVLGDADANNDGFPQLDYADFSGMKSLHAIPTAIKEYQQLKLRTLILHGSGILQPPRSEHGSNDQTNVAERVRSYFQDIDDFGKGSVNRCKVLLLGNGGAGKSYLANRVADAPKVPFEQIDTTDGLKLWDKKIKVPVQSEPVIVTLPIWDFGGQEIFHNTHRMFMSTGAVFVLLWRPEQDNKLAPKLEGCNYQDEWRPLQYWFDFIHHATRPYTPTIAVVCARHKAEEHVTSNRPALSANYAGSYELFHIDAKAGWGDLQPLEDWLKRSVQNVLEAEGRVVPSYWQIAQDMVQKWHSDKKKWPGNLLEKEQFQQRLEEAIMQDVASPNTAKRYSKLAKALDPGLAGKPGAFDLTSRLERTLEFLTRSGWLYWREDFPDAKVIVGQQWALDGLYTILFRKPENSRVFNLLEPQGGKFTRQELGEVFWDERYTVDEQETLLTFMESCGLCFKLVDRESSWRDADTYLSLAHLLKHDDIQQDDGEFGFGKRFDSKVYGREVIEGKICESEFLHRHDWHKVLMAFGKEYGTAVSYASDGIYFETKAGHVVLLTLHLNTVPNGRKKVEVMGGYLFLEVVGPECQKLYGELSSVVLAVVEDRHKSVALQGGSAPRGPLSVFVSYAGNSSEEKYRGVDFAKPVRAIVEFLKQQGGIVVYIDWEVEKGENLRKFMSNAEKSSRVLVFQSERYWHSAYCLYELMKVDSVFAEEKITFSEFVIPVRHPTCRLRTFAEDKENEYLQFWSNYLEPKPLPSLDMPHVRTREAFIEKAKVLIREHQKRCRESKKIAMDWSVDSDSANQAVLAEIVSRINEARCDDEGEA
jgi:hypothetical protein